MVARLIVGLGNPGMDKTRHNLGRMVVERIAERAGATFLYKKEFEGQIAKITLRGQRVFLLMPETYMNHSGRSVQKVMHYYDIPAQEVVVVVDDMAFDVGEMKLQPRGGSGGHNGLKDIEACIASQEYMRLRIGIGQAQSAFESHVLGRFTKEEFEALPIMQAVEVLESLIEEDFARVATKCNTKKGKL